MKKTLIRLNGPIAKTLLHFAYFVLDNWPMVPTIDDRTVGVTVY
jgi:hypothetical protein